MNHFSDVQSPLKLKMLDNQGQGSDMYCVVWDSKAGFWMLMILIFHNHQKNF